MNLCARVYTCSGDEMCIQIKAFQLAVLWLVLNVLVPACGLMSCNLLSFSRWHALPVGIKALTLAVLMLYQLSGTGSLLPFH